MENKHFVEGGWQWDYATPVLRHIRPGFYEEGQYLSNECFDAVIPRPYINSLVHFLDEEGLIRPKMNNQSREEDLKIVHRLLDLLDK